MLGVFLQKYLIFFAVAVVLVVAAKRVCFAAEASPGNSKSEALTHFLDLVFPECPVDFRDKILALAADPRGYFRNHAAEMEEGGYDEPYEGAYLSVLLSEMQARNKLWTMDWKEGRGEINAILRDLSDGRFSELLTDEDGPDEYAIADELLPKASAKMREGGMILLCLDTDSDSYTLMIVPVEKADAIIAAAGRCDIRIDKM